MMCIVLVHNKTSLRALFLSALFYLASSQFYTGLAVSAHTKKEVLIKFIEC